MGMCAPALLPPATPRPPAKSDTGLSVKFHPLSCVASEGWFNLSEPSSLARTERLRTLPVRVSDPSVWVSRGLNT